jgi:uncharacterized protein YbcC (UPF0753/DUF2309 family)
VADGERTIESAAYRESTLEPPPSLSEEAGERLADLQQEIEHAAHLLPTQAPIQVFVHHNTLHAFEHLPFADAVRQGGAMFGCHAYLPEDKYRKKQSLGRILPQDLLAELMDDLGDDADHLIGFFGTRFHLRLAMLQYPLRHGPDAELRWVIAETDALRKFRSEAPPNVREQMIAETRRWVMRDLRRNGVQGDPRLRKLTSALFERFRESQIERWSLDTWETFTLGLLWDLCYAAMQGLPTFAAEAPPLRPRDLLLEATGIDTDQLVNAELIRFCAGFLDQGIAHWTLPNREHGFFQSWSELYRDSRPVERWLRGLPKELIRIQQCGWGPLEVIDDALRRLGVADSQRGDYLAQTLLAMRGWAGMIWQMETQAEWTVHPAPAGSLVGYVAVRLILERLALSYVAGSALGETGELCQLATRLGNRATYGRRTSVDQRAYFIFQLAQVLGWKPETLYQQSRDEWAHLVREIEAFSAPERRRIYHLAFERRFRVQILDALIARASTPSAETLNRVPSFQVICCIDEREESFRRHLEELAPDCETFGVAGFFGVAMYYRGAADAHYVPLCPVVIKPQHYVQEEVVYSFADSHRRRTETRRAVGRTRHWLHTLNRSVVGGAATAILGSLASIPLVFGVLFPRLTARVRRLFASFVQPPLITRQLIERTEAMPGPDPGHLGYTIDEMVDISARVLRDIGLTENFARLVCVMGHGSSSLNNPHESAHDCGACGGGRGGPNARALAGMLNDPRVRERLAQTGLTIPRSTVVVGAYHNTCDDSLEYYDLDRLPSSHHDDFESAKNALDLVRCRNAHERCRRFESAQLSLSEEAALRHVEARAEDLSQVRPEYGHATNASCIVGRRARTKGLFLDRRAFLMSYDPTQDDVQHTILERILQAVIPVCAGINLEYYFCYVDPTGYGCGTKLPHNISGLLGVMDGSASDLRPGLPWQMVEIHEPVRILFVIEAPQMAIFQILDRNPGLNRLVHNEWVQLATLDPDTPAIHLLRRGEFESYVPESTTLPVVRSSLDWYRGWRDHLGCALVAADREDTTVRKAESRP